MNVLRTDFWGKPLLEEELSEEEIHCILRDLLTVESRELGAILLRSRPSRELRNLQPTPSFFYSFWISALWPFRPESVEQNFWWYLRELYEHQRHLRDLLSLVDRDPSGTCSSVSCYLHLAQEVDSFKFLSTYCAKRSTFRA